MMAYESYPIERQVLRAAFRSSGVIECSPIGGPMVIVGRMMVSSVVGGRVITVGFVCSVVVAASVVGGAVVVDSAVVVVDSAGFVSVVVDSSLVEEDFGTVVVVLATRVGRVTGGASSSSRSSMAPTLRCSPSSRLLLADGPATIGVARPSSLAVKRPAVVDWSVPSRRITSPMIRTMTAADTTSASCQIWSLLLIPTTATMY